MLDEVPVCTCPSFTNLLYQLVCVVWDWARREHNSFTLLQLARTFFCARKSFSGDKSCVRLTLDSKIASASSKIDSRLSRASLDSICAHTFIPEPFSHSSITGSWTLEINVFNKPVHTVCHTRLRKTSIASNTSFIGLHCSWFIQYDRCKHYWNTFKILLTVLNALSG